MKTTDLLPFLETYFTAYNCKVLHNHEGILTVQLTEEMDKALMNRPFYWHYIKSSGQDGDPKRLTLITNPNKRNEDGEWIHFGSPRLQQIIQHLKHGKNHVKLFQKVTKYHNTPLYPWLVTNIKITYQGKQKKEELFSIGLQLINGTMKTDMMSVLQGTSLNRTISDYCHSITPLIKLKSGFNRIETVLKNYVNNQTHDWALHSMKLLDEEIRMVNYFHDIDKGNEAQQKEKELLEITERYTPTITFNVINGGIVYLTDDYN